MEHYLQFREVVPLQEPAGHGRAAPSRASVRLAEGRLKYDAKEFATKQLASSTLPDVTKRRLAESLAGNPPATQSGQLDRQAFATRIAEAVKAETKWFEQVKLTGIAAPASAAGQRLQDVPRQPAGNLRESFAAIFAGDPNGAALAEAAARGRNDEPATGATVEERMLEGFKILFGGNTKLAESAARGRAW